MPLFVRREVLDSYTDRIARMQAELDDWRREAPFRQIGRALMDEVTELVQSTGAEADVGRMAYESVLAAQVDKARRELAAKYERDHRASLYERVLAETEAKEGPAILAEVTARLDTDAKLAAELHASARKEQLIKAKGIVAGHVTAQQEEAIQAEAARQVELDRFDVAFALTGELNLADNGDKLAELLRPGDRLVVMFRPDSVGQSGLAFDYRRDVNNVDGWVIGDAVRLSDNDYYRRDTEVQTATAPRDRFVTLGAQMQDLTRGKNVVRPNAIVADYPLALCWENARGNPENYPVQVAIHAAYNSYNNPVAVPNVATIDFQVRGLEFPAAA